MAKEPKAAGEPEKGSTEEKATEEAKKGEEAKGSEELPEGVRKAIQSEVDRVRTKYVQELKKKDEELEGIKKERMTDEEKRKFELDKREREIAEKDRLLKLAELRDKTRVALKAEELEDDLLDFVLGESEEATKERIKSMKALLNKREKGLKDAFLRATGRTVQQANIGDEGLMTEEQLKNLSGDYWKDPKLNERVLRSQAALFNRR